MDDPATLPALFLAHGAPTLALEGGDWGVALSALGAGLPGIRAALVCSAHWESEGGFQVGSAPWPATLHDFGGFPEALHRLAYPAPGDPALARQVVGLLSGAGFDAGLDPTRGLDHGVWVPLRSLLPRAPVPVVPLSLPRRCDPRALREAGRALAPLRDEGVLILGSGGLVHPLGRLGEAGSAPPPWATSFERWILDGLARDRDGVLAWMEAPGAAFSAPTSEHLDPLWLALGASRGDPVQTVHEGWQLGSLSLRCLAFGPPLRG